MERIKVLQAILNGTYEREEELSTYEESDECNISKYEKLDEDDNVSFNTSRSSCNCLILQVRIYGDQITSDPTRVVQVSTIYDLY